MYSSKEVRISRILILIGLNGLLFYAVLFLLNALVLVFGGRVHAITFWLSSFVTIAASIWVGKKEQSIEESFAGSLGTIILFSGAYVYQAFKIDTSWDGVSYHAQAVLEFIEGWNPYYYNLSPETPHRIWLSHYPLASWLTAASVYAALPIFGGMKVFSMFLPLSAFCFSAGILRCLNFNWLLAFLLGGILALNPVAVTEHRSLYLDGQLACFWLALVLALIWRYREKTHYFFIFCTLSSTVVINLKFTGLVLVILLLTIGLFAYTLLKRYELLLPVLFSAGISIVMGFNIIGYAPYIRNLSEQGHIFFPLMGNKSKTVDIMNNYPPYQNTYGNKSHFYKFFTSYGSYCQFLDKEINWRIPFATHADERHVWAPGEWITAGFGPMFSGILLVTCVLIGIISFQPAFQPYIANFLMIAGAYFASVLIIPENWLARYVPHFWLLPWLIWGFIWLKSSALWQKIILLMLLLVGYWNVGHIADHSIKSQDWSETRWWRDYQKIGYGSHIYWGPFPALATRMREHGINFTSVHSLNELPCNQEERIPVGNLPGIWACPPPK